MNMQPPGWYPDPSGTPDFLRWWDGTAWADATQPAYPQTGYGQGQPDPQQQGWYEQPQNEDEQAGYQQAAYPPEAYDQTGYQQGDFPPGAYDQGAYDQGGYEQAGHQQGGYDQGPYEQAGHQQGGYQQGGYDQAGFYHGGYEQGGYAQPQQHGQGWPDAGAGWRETGPAWEGVEEKQRKTWPWFVAGGSGFLVIVIIAVVALFATGIIGGPGQTPQNSPSPAAKPSAAGDGGQTPGGGSTSPVVGQIKDSKAGISYAKLGGNWAVLQPGGDQGMDNWTAGQYQVAQAEYKPGQDYIATYASAPLSASAGYGGPDDLERLTTALAEEVETGYYPEQHSREDVESKAVTVDGHQAWKTTFTMSFPQAEAKGWEFHGERVAIMLIDRGDGNQPAAFYFTLPDNLPLRGDMETVVSSIKVTE